MSEASVHPTAVVESAAQLGEGAIVGPYAVIGPDVVIGKGVEVGAHAVIQGHTVVGDGSVISSFSSIGLPPQDLGYKGEPTRVEIGQRCQIREYVSIHRGTPKGGGLTRVGDDCMIMAYSHVAHDCRVGDHVIMANGATLAGHVEIQEYAVIGGLTAIHQFARIGRHGFIGGASAVSMDVIPFASAAGNRTKVTGVNVVGLRRRGFSEEAIKAIRHCHRLIFRSGLRLEQALESIEKDPIIHFPEVVSILEFIQTSQRGICR
ncbi:acyl-[acyl-carrier-protein]--UDP-N-acetylglucosamine O-acyltransferase [Magnetococcus marinus MC-1]|uniref:Acyl-[acyl-carrier-protein]--UDP-N-acetylglucosamine O-acyltransferase n=1 Tax=Magnetococcus marinus (strain ATCC BAA-1437 / JCM 17883 / MC-1) TaxID=156889 RepID=A0L8R6_MAGMM|nr:acyl-ACP--UDP-N-acetylglucosamine O-acyltransferase [Magnetococcus marinus]ABK44359.1 acyl-[acyl-carrier-protein]--UDP-N-acetylglucosamine O-acyltransferase [Magnetococcus marinus MC-1]